MVSMYDIVYDIRYTYVIYDIIYRMMAKLHCVEETAGGLTVRLTSHGLQILTPYVIHLQRIQCDILIIPQCKKKKRRRKN